MKADRIDLGLTGYDELFMSTEERLDAKKPKVDELPLDELKPFKDHPFKVIGDEEMERLKDSIRESGVLIPALARPAENGYELISGHRRLAACRALGLSTMPVIVRNLTDEEAVIAMVDSNLQREHILPSEKAFAYKMKLEAMKHQGKRTSDQLGQKFSVETIADNSPDSKSQVQRYIRLARIMQDEQHLNCTAYWASKGINRGGKKSQPNPYKWKSSTIHGILTRQEYCGDVLNFKTHSKSFKNHRRIDNPKEDWMVFEDRHEAIIERDTYKKVQKRLKSTHQRAPKEANGPKSIFCDILRCADCGSKMWYHTNTQNKDIHYFSCSNYVKDYRGTCLTRHYIRADAVEAVVEMELRRLAEYLVADENRFAEILARKSNKQYESEKKAAASELRKSEMRIEMIPRLLKSLYEDKLSGKTSEENYSILSSEYADEREQLKKKILKLRKKLAEMGEKESEREEFIRAIRKFMEMRTLTKQVLNELIDHIDVYETQGTGKNKTQRLVIYYKFVGYLDIDPTRCHPNYTADIREGVAVEYVSCEPSEGMKELFPEQYGVDDDSFEEEETEQA